MNTSKLKSTFLGNLYLAVGVVGSLFFVLILLVPSISLIPSLRAQIKSKNEELKQLRERSGHLNALLSNQSTLKVNLKLVDVAIPSKDDVPNLMTQIQRIATESGVVLKALQFGSGALMTSGTTGSRIAADKSIKRVVLQVLSDGPFGNIQSFLRNLENASRLLSVDSLSFESKKDVGRITATMVLTSYYIDSVGQDSASVLDLSDEEIKSTLSKIKQLKVYESEATPSVVGKANPFE